MTVFIVGQGGGGDADAPGNGLAGEVQSLSSGFEIGGKCGSHCIYLVSCVFMSTACILVAADNSTVPNEH